MKKQLVQSIIGAGLGLAVLAGSLTQAASPSKSYTGVNALNQTEVLGNKAPQGVTIGTNDVKMMTLNQGRESVKQSILDAGAMHADVYQLMYKSGPTVKYATLADIKLGLNGARQLLGANVSDVKVLNAHLAGAINSDSRYGYNSIMPYRIIEPMKVVGKTYVGTIQTTTTQAEVTYRENVHLVIYDDKYGGPSVRALALNADDEQGLWPQLATLMKVK